MFWLELVLLQIPSVVRAGRANVMQHSTHQWWRRGLWSNGNNTTVLWGITACPARVPRLESRQQAGTGLSGSDLQLPQVRQSPAGPGTGTVGAGNILCKKTKYFHCNSDNSNPPLSPGPDCLPCPPVSLCRSEDGEWCAPPPQGLAWLRR